MFNSTLPAQSNSKQHSYLSVELPLISHYNASNPNIFHVIGTHSMDFSNALAIGDLVTLIHARLHPS